MKKLKIAFVLLFIPAFIALSQDYLNVDKIVDSYPRNITKPEKLAEMINRDFKTNVDKARAVYRWVASNIKYDVDAYYSGVKSVSYSYSSPEEKRQKELELQKKQVEQTLKRKKAVCEGYSGLFQNLCDMVGVECVTILGYSKTLDKDIGRIPKSTDHAWNAIKIDNKWKLIDVTWGAGSVDYSKKAFIPKFTDIYFLTPPDLFFLKHFPEKKEWLLVNKSLEDFIELPLYYSEFAVSGISIIKPGKGIIRINPNDKIEFKWKTNLDPKDLNYGFKGDKYARELIAEHKDDILSFEIAIGKSVPGLITFYYKGSAVISYKLEKK
jgi:transglutaminase/protease-like cytokinesis protein 3